MVKDFTKLITNLMLDTKDLAEWGIEGGHTTAEKLRLTVSARQEQAKKLIANGMSQRKVAKLLGVGKTTIQGDVVGKRPAGGRKATIDPAERCASILSKYGKEEQVAVIRALMEKLHIGIRDFAETKVHFRR